MERTLGGLKETTGLTELKLDVCRKAYAEARNYCGTAIADLLGSIKDQLPDDAVQMLDWLATEHSDPEEELGNTEASGGTADLLTRGINTTRGRAAEAIFHLILRDAPYIEVFRATIKRMVRDDNIAVRACVGRTLLGIANHNWEFALEQFRRLIEPRGSQPSDDHLLATSCIENFIHHGLRDAFRASPLSLSNGCSGQNFLKQVRPVRGWPGLAVLYNHNEAENLSRRSTPCGNPSQRLGVAEVASENIGKPVCRLWSEQQLLRLFNDGDRQGLSRSCRVFP